MVLVEHGEPVPRPDARRLQRPGGAAHPIIDLRPGPDDLTGSDGLTIRSLRDPALDDVVDAVQGFGHAGFSSLRVVTARRGLPWCWRQSVTGVAPAQFVLGAEGWW